MRGLQYSPETDVAKRTESLKNKFPVLKQDSEALAYSETYALAMTARVGSTALLTWLQAAGLSNNRIHELFNNRGSIDALTQDSTPKSLCEYLNKYSTLSGFNRLAFKTGWWDMAPLLNMIGWEVEEWFPSAKWVYLERRDKLAQAYSLWKMAKYKVSHRKHDEPYRSPVSSNIPIDSIRERIQLIEMEDECWQRFFEDKNIDVHHIYYEDFRDEPKTTLREVYFAYTNDYPDDNVECPLTMTTDETDLKNLDFLRSRIH
jgi:LPS sulfotransferase NodH